VFPETLLEVLRHEAPVAIATQGADGPHLVNTWNSYVQLEGDDTLIVPVGGFHKTEANLGRNDRVKLTISSREVIGKRGSPGAGYLIAGTAKFYFEGPCFEKVKQRFAWARAALVVKVESAEQTA